MSANIPSQNPNKNSDESDKATLIHRTQLRSAIEGFATYGNIERDEETGRSVTHLGIELTPDAVEALPETVTRHFPDLQGEQASTTYRLSASHGDEGADAFFGTEDFWPDSVELQRTTVNAAGWDRWDTISYNLYKPTPENPSGIERDLKVQQGYQALMRGLLLGEKVESPWSDGELDRAIDAARQNLANVENPNTTPEEDALASELSGLEVREATDLIGLLHSQTGPIEY